MGGKTPKDLLYSTDTRYLVITYNGKESTYLSVYLSIYLYVYIYLYN